MRWTQEQRQQAIRDTEAMMMDSDRATAVESYNDAAIELACQRNALLEALKAIVSTQGSSIRERDNARAAIEKAESQ